jgi:hypothetical protein
MNRQRLFTGVAIACGLGCFGISQGFAYVGSTIATYEHAAPCGKLVGFAGLLQTTGFIPTGDCTVDVKKGGCHDSRACKISNPPSGSSDKGKCTPSADHQSCYCAEK